MSSNPRITRTAALLACTIAVLWGGNTVAVRYSVDTLPPIFVAGLRFLIGSLFMLGWCRVESSPIWLSRETSFPCLVTGALLFVQIGLFNVGVDQSSASHGALFINTFVFWVIAIEHFVTRVDRLDAKRFLGVCLAAGSVLLLLTATDRSEALHFERDRPTMRGDIILCLSAFVLGLKVLWTKHAVKTVRPGTLILWQSIIGSVLFFLWSYCFESPNASQATWPAIWGVIYQGVFVAGICFVVQARLIRTYSATQISVFAFLTPLAGVIFGIAMRNDVASPWLVVAATGITLGILFVNSSKPPRQSDQSEALTVEADGTAADST